MDSKEPRPPTFMKGYPNPSPQTYMNIGYRRSPYPGKVGQGDYGPHQGGEIYYKNDYTRDGIPSNLVAADEGITIYDGTNPWNPTHIYPLDFSTSVSRVAKIQGSYSDNIPLYLLKK